MMTRLSPRGGLVATTALVAAGLLFLTPEGRELMRPGALDVAEIPAPRTPEDSAAGASPEPATLAESAPSGQAAAESEPAETSVVSDPAALADQSDSAAAPPPVASIAEAPMAESAPMPLARVAPAAPMRLEAAGNGIAYEEVMPFPEDSAEAFANEDSSGLRVTAEEPVSTFSIDVDTASWSVIRSFLSRGTLPPAEAVRIEEMINYFPYDYPAPAAGEAPFAVDLGVIETPWNEGTQLVRIGLQGILPVVEDRPPLNLVFLIDTSGSMESPDKLPLLVQSFRLMLSELRPEDEVAIVTYAGSAGRVLDPTPASERETILAALDQLTAGGSTNGQGGLEQAYATAAEMAGDGEVGRVILATDGDFNVGLSDPEALEDFIAERRDSSTYLSVLGFGRGNLDDATMQALAQTGNGTAAYIETLSEAQKVLVDQLTGALFPIADDVKIQVEWNPAAVAEYRLIGYETRALRREDFNNDAVDAGELGAGHSVTALYEITPTGSPARLTDPLRYSAAETDAPASDEELGFLRLRYKAPGEDASRLIEAPIATDLTADDDTRFAAAIAGFGELLRGSDYLGDWSYAEAIDLANSARGDDPFGYRTEAVRLMRLAQSIAR
ncbi:YfbK domain-containing protein [Histidinibacterium lentulum]